MTGATKKRQQIYAAGAQCLVGAVVLSACLAGWLTDPLLSQQIWPNDIHRFVVEILGGDVTTNAAGELETTLSVSSVAMRFASALLLAAGLIIWRHLQSRQRQSTKMTQAFQRTALTSLVGVGWWFMWITGELTPLNVQGFCIAVLPLWLSTTCGLIAWIWLSAIFAAGDENRPAHGRRFVSVTAMLTVAWIAISFWMNKCLYDQLLIPHGDSAMYEEHLWNIWHGKGFRSYLDQGLFLGEHIQVIHVLLLPLHMLWPSHLLLELAESVALGSCTVPIFLITKRQTQSYSAAACLAIAWLFYYPMHFLDIAIDQKTFRPIALALPAMFWMIEFAERGSFWKMLVCLVVALSAKEDVALVVFPILLALGVARMRSERTVANDEQSTDIPANRFFLAATGVGIYLVLAVLVIIPAFRSGDHVHYARYFGDLGATPGELIRTAISEPVRIVAQLASARTMLYVCVFLAPLAWLPIRSPLVLLSGILSFGMLSLLEFGDSSLPPVPYHHFHAPLIVVVFWAASRALGHHRRSGHDVEISSHAQASPSSLAFMMLCCCVSTSAVGSMMPFGVSFWSHESPFSYSNALASQDPAQLRRVAYADAVVAEIPRTARVAATDYIHTRLTHCERSYDYSGYLRAVNNYEPGVPDDTDYIVIDTSHRYSEIKSAGDVRELREEPDEWELLPDTTEGTFLILKRR